MSHQPSNVDILRSTAADAAQAVAEKLNPDSAEQSQGEKWGHKQAVKEAQKETAKTASYKEQLDEAAKGGADGLQGQQSSGSKSELFNLGLR
jgi:hypothetical protein